MCVFRFPTVCNDCHKTIETVLQQVHPSRFPSVAKNINIDLPHILCIYLNLLGNDHSQLIVFFFLILVLLLVLFQAYRLLVFLLYGTFYCNEVDLPVFHPLHMWMCLCCECPGGGGAVWQMLRCINMTSCSPLYLSLSVCWRWWR